LDVFLSASLLIAVGHASLTLFILEISSIVRNVKLTSLMGFYTSSDF
jgi:hypothetical protein